MMWYRPGDGTKWTSPWTSLPGGPYAAQPAAASWEPGRLNVFTVSPAAGSTVLSMGFVNGSWNSSWEALPGPAAASAIGLCELPLQASSSGAGVPSRIDMWVVDAASKGIQHDYSDNSTDDFASFAFSGGPYWDPSMDDLPSASAPALACRNGIDPEHNLLIYSTDGGSIRHRTYAGATGSWSSWADWGGNFVGDPLIVPVGVDRFEFFGLGADKAIYHLTWTIAGGASVLESLGGSFESVPSAVVTGLDPVRIDVVALGADDDLIKHRAYVGSSWAMDWEDLGVWGNSAPLVFNYQVAAGSPNVTGIAVVGAKNEMNYTSWPTTSSSQLSWKGLGTWAGIGGNWTTAFLGSK